MTEHRRRFALALSCVATLAAGLTSTASAATLNLGAGNTSPHVVVSPGGVGFLTWADLQSNQVLHYCRLQPGAGACDVSKSFTYGAMIGGTSDEGNSPVFAGSASNVTLVDQRLGVLPSGQRFVFTSTDGGANFTPTTPSGTNEVGSGSNGLEAQAVYAPGSSFDASITTPRLLGIADGAITNGADFQGTQATGGSVFTTTFSMSGGSSTASSSIALGGSTLLAAYTDLSGNVYTRRYSGSGGQNNSAAWGSPVFVAAVGGPSFRSQLVAGGPGLPIYIAYPDSSGAIALRAYNGTGWGAPTEMTGPNVNDVFGVFEDTAGIVHLVYRDSDFSLKYRYARSTANNDFTNPQTLGSADGTYREPHVATDASGNGFITWSDTTSDFVQPIAPGEGPAPGGGDPGAGGGPTKPGDSIPIGGGAAVELTVPANCVPSGSSFQVSVDLAMKHMGHEGHKRHSGVGRKAKVKSKLKEVDFFKGNTLVSKVKKKPFQATISTAGVSSGILEITAKATIKVKKQGHKAKKVKKTLRSTVSIC